MDLSKLPKLSKTQTPPPAPPVESIIPLAHSGAPMSGFACPYCASPLRAGARFCDSCGSALRVASPGTAGAVGMGAEAWISIGIGLLLLFLNPDLVKFASSKVLHTHFAPYADATGKPNASDSALMMKNDESGNSVVSEVRPYLKTNGENSPNFPNDLAITSFALALILEGIALVLSRRPIVVLFALSLTVVATLYNLLFFVSEYAHYKTIPMISALAVIFGGYMAVYQYSLLHSSRAESQQSRP